MREIAFSVSEYLEVDIQDKMDYYMSILYDQELDFNLFVLLAGESYFSSDFYTDDFENSQYAIIQYLIDENYDGVTQVLINHYQDNQRLLEGIIEYFPIYLTYQKVISQIETLENYFDYPEVVKVFEWATNGFSISGEA